VFLAYWLTAFLSGAGVLVVEMTAPRALAPWFGQAQFVWTNVIGLVLAGLAIGSMVGGRLADRRASPGLLGGLLLAGAGLVALSAWLPQWVARALLPERLPLEAAYPFLQRGSFLATLICFVPPVVLLGAVPPFLVRCATKRLEEVGRQSGLLYGAATLGSIAGSFATSYLLLEPLGTRGTQLLAAALLAVSAVPLFVASRRVAGGVAGGAAALLLAAALLPPANRAAAAGAALGELLVARDSRYQHLEVRHRDELCGGARVLAIDEGHDSFQSLTPDEGVLTDGLYYDYVNLLALDAVRDGKLRVAILGMGAGTHARQLLELVGPRCDLSIAGVELDPEVVALGRSHLALPDDPRLSIASGLDARTFADHSDATFDLVLVDCYSHQSFVPPHVASSEFFAAVARRLRDGGVLALNVFGYGAADPVSEAVAATLLSRFPDGIVVASLPGTANQLVWGCKGGVPRRPCDWPRDEWPEPLQELAARLLAPAQFFVRRARDGERVVHDDDGWFDRLQERRLEARAAALLAREGAR